MRFLLLILLFVVTLIANAQENESENPQYSYDAMIDNPDTNQATFFLTFNIFNLNINMQDLDNGGFFPALQAIYSPASKKWGAELNYETAIGIEEGIEIFKNATLDIGGFYNFKQKTKYAHRNFRVNSYSFGTKRYIEEKKVPIKLKTGYGVRGGINREKAVYRGSSRTNANSVYTGLTLHRNSRSVLDIYRGDFLINTHDYSRWSITNLDILYQPNVNIFRDPDFYLGQNNNLSSPSLPEDYNPFGFRISHQRLYSVSRKEQYQKATRASFKTEFGKKPLLGYYLKLTVGVQLIRW